MQTVIQLHYIIMVMCLKVVLQEMAVSMDICAMEKGHSLFECSGDISDKQTKLIVVNKGTVLNVPKKSKAPPNSVQFRESLRFPAFLPDQNLGQTNNSEVQDSKFQQTYRGKGRRDLASAKLRPRSGARPRMDMSLGIPSSGQFSSSREETSGSQRPQSSQKNYSAHKQSTLKKSDAADTISLLPFASIWPVDAVGEMDASVGYGQAFW